MSVDFDNRQLALILAVACSPRAGQKWQLATADQFLGWLEIKEPPPDVSWVQTGDIKEVQDD